MRDESTFRNEKEEQRKGTFKRAATTMDGKQIGGHLLTTVTFAKDNGHLMEVAAANVRMAK